MALTNEDLKLIGKLVAPLFGELRQQINELRLQMFANFPTKSEVKTMIAESEERVKTELGGSINELKDQVVGLRQDLDLHIDFTQHNFANHDQRISKLELKNRLKLGS
jgi:hypothetical protein